MPSTVPTACEQVGEQRPWRGREVAGAAGGELQVAAVAVDVLPEQRHLGDAFGSERFDLGDDVGERAADLLAAHSRDDAEGARVVAADLDRDPRVVRRRPPCRQRRREQGVVVDHRCLEDLGDRPVAPRLAEQFGGAMHVVRAHHDVDVARPLTHDVAVLLGEAAGDDDLATVAFGLPRLEVAEVAVQLVVGVLADAARVEHDDVGVRLGRGGDHPVGFEQPGDALRVVLVHLTAERAHEVAARESRAPGRGYRPCCGGSGGGG